jgi:hypothetical protein
VEAVGKNKRWRQMSSRERHAILADRGLDAGDGSSMLLGLIVIVVGPVFVLLTIAGFIFVLVRVYGFNF